MNILNKNEEINEAIILQYGGNKKDKNFVLKAVKKHGTVLQLASIELRADKEVVLEAVKQNGWALEFASEELRADKEFMKEVVSIKIAQEEAKKNHNRQQTKQNFI